MNTVADWLPHSDTPPLSDDDVHVWRASLDLDPDLLHTMHTSLAPDEQARAARFKFDRDRHRFIAARGILRRILGAYLARQPASLSFTYGPHGKPALNPNDGGRMIQFNVSHAHGMALYAFANTREVGVDIEAVRPMADWEAIARRFFSPQEVTDILSRPKDLQQEAFFRCWTRKEAYLKARGSGMTLPLKSFVVRLSEDGSDALQSEDRDRWSLCGLNPAPGYAGAVVGEGKDWRLRCWSWSGPAPDASTSG